RAPGPHQRGGHRLPIQRLAEGVVPPCPGRSPTAASPPRVAAAATPPITATVPIPMPAPAAPAAPAPVPAAAAVAPPAAAAAPSFLAIAVHPPLRTSLIPATLTNCPAPAVPGEAVSALPLISTWLPSCLSRSLPCNSSTILVVRSASRNFPSFSSRQPVARVGAVAPVACGSKTML